MAHNTHKDDGQEKEGGTVDPGFYVVLHWKHMPGLLVLEKPESITCPCV